MKVYDAPNIRNVALVGHGGCGKTSLASAMLFDMGAVNRLGRVDDGTTVTDFDPDEIERKISLQTALAYGEWKKIKVNLLDAPGYANFLPEARSALRVADAAIVVVDAVAGVEVQTEKVWGYAEEYGLPRIIVVNRMDRDRASFAAHARVAREGVRTRSRAPRHPPRRGEGLRGRDRPPGREGRRLQRRPERQVRDGGGARGVPRPPQRRLRDKLVEMVAETNEALMEEFFEKGTLPQDDLVKGLRQAVVAGTSLPRPSPSPPAATSACSRCSTTIVDLFPSPTERGEVQGTDPVRRRRRRGEPAADAPFSAFVFKTVADPHAGRISVFRVYSGVFKSDSTVHNANRDTAERVGHLELLAGQDPDAGAGDPGGRPGGGGQAQGDADRGYALRQGASHRVSPARASRSPPRPSPSSPRPGATRTRSRRPCTG